MPFILQLVGGGGGLHIRIRYMLQLVPDGLHLLLACMVLVDIYVVVPVGILADEPFYF